MNNSRSVGVSKLDSPLVGKGHGGQKQVSDSGELFADIRHQTHEPSAFDSGGNGVLTDSRATTLAATDDLPVAIDQLGEQLDVLVIDVHRPGTVAIDEDRVFALGS